MKPELVKKVVTELVAAHLVAYKTEAIGVAHYALALAKRAARWAECGHVGSAAVERAVEG